MLRFINKLDMVVNGHTAILVQSKTAGKPFMVERSMYWNNKGAGTDTIGGFSDWDKIWPREESARLPAGASINTRLSTSQTW